MYHFLSDGVMYERYDFFSLSPPKNQIVISHKKMSFLRRQNEKGRKWVKDKGAFWAQNESERGKREIRNQIRVRFRKKEEEEGQFVSDEM